MPEICSTVASCAILYLLGLPNVAYKQKLYLPAESGYNGLSPEDNIRHISEWHLPAQNVLIASGTDVLHCNTPSRGVLAFPRITSM